MRIILPLPGNEPFAERLAAAGGWRLGSLASRRFPDGESYLRIDTDISGRPVDLVCTLAHPDAKFLPLAFAADALRDMGASQVNLVSPYLAYMRQDIRFRQGEAITSRTFARLLSGSVDHLYTVDPHLHRYRALSDLYAIPTTTLQAAPLLGDWVAANVGRPLVIGPDEESEQWAAAIAERAGAPCAVLRKTRHGDRNVDIHVPDLSQWRGHQPVLVDDIASSGRTMIEAARQLTAQGLPKPVCAVVHGLFADEAYAQLQALSRRIISTDSVPHASNAIGLAPLIAQAIQSGPARSVTDEASSQ